ncbi:lipopolysaccharide biosynthesis protein [Algibacter pectinivorans]|uniref:Membrane protein involved in the export of O-antigen and teichoic acid n=1 Tax=Algibacter pectinivorans TaxID=870482 RepID=A0A1I1PE04_9FLAO|nr:oligosaccharide flippase family protein [Algibacter pectinivorans]SFD07872.1 Membrane protein involved in the export of O-antigen and teichoic acid [Algibacter pectinivorans]
MSQLKKGAFLNYATIVLTNVIGLLMTPFILNHLGKSEYGIYLTIGALVGTISLLDFGLNNTIVRFVAKYRAENDSKGQENFLATTMLLYLIISTVIVSIGIIFYNYIDTYFTKMNASEIEIAKTIYKIFIFNLAIGLPGAALTGICYGHENFVFPKTLNIARYILRSITVVAVLILGGKSISLVIIDSVFNILIIGITSYYVFKKLKVKIKLHEFSIKFIKHIFSYSTWIFVFALVSLFQWKAGHWVLGRISPPEILTIYGIGIVLGTYYGAFSTAISSVFLPRATKMSVDDASGEELTDMMIKIGRLSFIVLMFILTAFTLFGKQFVFLWVGSELGEDGSFQSWIIALMIMVAYTLPLVQGFGNSILEAKSKLRFKAILYLSFMLIGTVLGAILAKKYQAIGMMVGTVIAWLIVQNVMNFYYHKTIGLNIPRFFKSLLNKTFVVVIIAFAIGYAINFIPGFGWWNFIIKAVIYAVVFSLLMYNMGLIPFEKQLFKTTLSPVLKFLK